MKNKTVQLIDNIAIAVLSISLLVAGAIDISSKPDSKNYRDQNMTFVFPGDYLAIPTTYEGMTIVEIKNNDKKFADVAIVALSQDNSESLESMLASSYDDFYSKQIKKIYKNSSEGYQFTQVNQDESAIYTYIKNSDYIAMIKFYESYYKPDQPLIKISNQLLLKDFYALVNSFQIIPNAD